MHSGGILQPILWDYLSKIYFCSPKIKKYPVGYAAIFTRQPVLNGRICCILTCLITMTAVRVI
jgi:hypothetical protein